MTFTVWRNIQIGTQARTGEYFLRLLKKDSFGIAKNAECLLKHRLVVVARTQTLNLVRVSVQELGFNYQPTYNDICKRAVQLGLHICPAEVGPQLRLQYQDQPEGEWVTVGMEPIEGDGGVMYVFGVARTYIFGDRGGLSVCHVNKAGADTWRLQDVFVFFL